MRISIIIPTLNEGAHIQATLRHLRMHASSLVAEILVVDGGSADDTQLLAREEGARVLQSPAAGRALQMNFGALHSQGDVLYFVHADTLPPASYAAGIESAVSKGWQMGNFPYRFDKPGLHMRFLAAFTYLPMLYCQGGDKTFFIRKSAFLHLGGFDNDHVIMEEYDLIRRAWKAGYRLVTLRPASVVSSRKYAKNSWLRVQIANVVVYNAWAWGLAKPMRLREMYRKLLR